MQNMLQCRDRQLLSLEQEHELLLYIEKCKKQGLPPTRKIIQNFAGTIAKWEVSESWVTRFLHRHADELTIVFTWCGKRHICFQPHRIRSLSGNSANRSRVRALFA